MKIKNVMTLALVALGLAFVGCDKKRSKTPKQSMPLNMICGPM